MCIDQGEELGLTEADLAFEDLQDPYGIRFWPEFKGRDGCRTPMVWESAAANGGFSAAKPWLPVPPEHQALAADRQEADPDSQLNLTRRLIALRQSSPALRTGELKRLEASESILDFERIGGGQRLRCVFNLGQETAAWKPIDGAPWRIVEWVGSLAGAALVQGPGLGLPPFSGFIAEAVAT